MLGFVTGAASVLLAVRENPWNWPVGIANNIFFFVLFWNAKLYADAVLQIVYIAISVFGWWNWLRGGEGHSELPITKTSVVAGIVLTLLTVAASAALTLCLKRFTDSVTPLADAVTTALSLTAQYMLSRKLLENWYAWMVADVIYVVLYIYKDLYLTGVLYMVFLGMCFAGYARWRRSFEMRQASIAHEVAAR